MIWANDIAWKRKNLFDDGHVDRPQTGRWRLTEVGVKAIEGKKENWLKLEDPIRRKEVLEIMDYCTPELLNWMLRIAKGDKLNLRKEPVH
jgi:hypothetical protein